MTEDASVTPRPAAATAAVGVAPSDAAALRDSEMRLRAILETAVEGIITIDDHGIVETINQAAVNMFGWQPDEIIGKNVSLLMPSPYREEHDRHIETYCRTGQARIIGIGREVVGQRKDGSIFPLELSVSEVQLHHGRIFTGLLRDITARKGYEEQLAQLARRLAEKNKELETILYVASHDLRSPLVNIQGFSKELSRACTALRLKLAEPEFVAVRPAGVATILNEDIPESVEFIEASVAKMDSLLSGFLRFSRMGKAALNIEKLDMNQMVAGIALSLEYQFKRAGAELELDDLPPCLGDATQIDQVFTNLLDNALKYLAPDRRGLIKVHGYHADGRSVYVVEDNGIGIDLEHQARIFEIFHRLNPSASPGEGLGLTIALRILERHDGKIWIDSELGKGSKFFVSLPSPIQETA